MPSLEDEMNSEMKLVLIHSGEDEEGFRPVLMKWVTDVLAQRAEFEPWLVEPASLLVRPGNAAVIQRQESLRHLAEADAFLIITSEQSNVYHCELKAFIDQVSLRWQARPVAFIGYGGASGGLCAVSQLRQVLAGQHAVPICNVVSFPDPWALIDGAGAIRQPDQARLPMARMLVQLNWWARALKAAREQMPYERVR
jgi:NAD(P)H-dependent FMN reductase